eukprot:XP_017167918.1 PREDICTED: uncharacterized protein LOC101055630 isoform X2 [Mus musculus]
MTVSFLVFCSHLTCQLGRQRNTDNQGRHSSKYHEREPLLPWKTFRPSNPSPGPCDHSYSEPVLERKSSHMPPWKAETQIIREDILPSIKKVSPCFPRRHFVPAIPLQFHVTIPTLSQYWKESHLTTLEGRESQIIREDILPSIKKGSPSFPRRHFVPAIPLQFHVTIPTLSQFWKATLEGRETQIIREDILPSIKKGSPSFPRRHFVPAIPLQFHVTIPTLSQFWKATLEGRETQIIR